MTQGNKPTKNMYQEMVHKSLKKQFKDKPLHEEIEHVKENCDTQVLLRRTRRLMDTQENAVQGKTDNELAAHIFVRFSRTYRSNCLGEIDTFVEQHLSELFKPALTVEQKRKIKRFIYEELELEEIKTDHLKEDKGVT